VLPRNEPPRPRADRPLPELAERRGGGPTPRAWRELRKIASGSVNVNATAVSPSTSMPRTSRARPSATSLDPQSAATARLDRTRLRVEHAQERALHVRSDERSAVVEGDTGRRWKTYRWPLRSAVQRSANPGKLAVGVELREAVE